MVVGSGRPESRPWIRATWLVTHNDVCVEHGSKIFTSAKPYVRRARHDFSHYMRDQRSEFEFALANKETFDVSPYDRYFSDRFLGGHLPVELLDPLPYYIACRLCAIVGRMALGGNDSKRCSKYGARVEGSRRFGFDLLAERPRFLDYLSELNAGYLKRKLSAKGNSLYGELQRYLSAHVDIPELRPFIDMVREHAMSALPIGPEDRFIGGGGVRRLHSVLTAANETGVHSTVLRKILTERGIIGKHEGKTPDNKVIFSAADLENAASDHRDSLHFQDVPPILGVSAHIVMRIVEIGALQPAFGVSKGMRAKFTKSSVDALLSSLIGNAEVREEDLKIVPLARAFGKAGCQIADIIRALIDGRVATRYVSKDSSRVGLARILVDLAEVKAAFFRPVSGLTIAHFNKAVCNKHSGAKAFMYSGFFQIESELRGNNVMHDIVTTESYDSFFREHASLAELANGWMFPCDLRKKLARANIHPVWTLRHRRALTFYRRAEVEAYRLDNP